MKRELEPQLKSEKAQKLYKILAELSKPDDIAAFLRDIMTLEELDETIRRFEVASLLKQGKTNRDIVQQTKMSSATISRINYWLHHGTGGYDLALKKLK